MSNTIVGYITCCILILIGLLSHFVDWEKILEGKDKDSD